jgi:hypothetical protein
MAIKYKEDPNKDDFMNEVLELLGEWANNICLLRISLIFYHYIHNLIYMEVDKSINSK